MLLKIENPQRLMREHHMGVGLSPALRIKLICIDMMLLIMSSPYHNSFSCQLKFSFFSCLSVRVCKELSIFSVTTHSLLYLLILGKPINSVSVLFFIFSHSVDIHLSNSSAVRVRGWCFPGCRFSLS